MSYSSEITQCNSDQQLHLPFHLLIKVTRNAFTLLYFLRGKGKNELFSLAGMEKKTLQLQNLYLFALIKFLQTIIKCCRSLLTEVILIVLIEA